MKDSTGNDTLEGGTGNDTYIFGQGYGQDVIKEDYYALNSDYDIVKFSAGLTPQTMEIIRQGSDLIFKIKGSSDRLTIKDQFDYAFEVVSIEEFQFNNSSLIWTKEDIKNYLLQSTNGDDRIIGYSEELNSETLDGGFGNDTLEGGSGNDLYIFKKGYGQDLIKEGYYRLNSYYDTVKFGAGLDPSTMEIVREENNLVFKVKGSSDRLTIKDQFDYAFEVVSIEEFQFNNGSLIWTKNDIRGYLLSQSTNGDDHIVGYSDDSSEVLKGGLGNDTLEGHTGDDTYIFNYGYGQDTIIESDYYYDSNYDTVKFGTGFTPTSMNIVRNGYDLIIRSKISNDQLTIKEQFRDYNTVEAFQFNNGAIIWNKATIESNAITNNAPTNLTLSINNVAENQPIGTTIGNLTTTDPNIGDTFTYNLVNTSAYDDQHLFYISNNQLKTNAVFDYENKGSYTIQVQTTDTWGLSYIANLQIKINDVKESPIDLTLSNNNIAENSAIGTTIGNLLTTDPDKFQNFTYSLVSGIGDDDNNLFTLSSNRLKSKISFNFEAKNRYTIRVRTTDQDGLSYEKQLAINITDVNEPQEIIIRNGNYVGLLTHNGTTFTSNSIQNTWLGGWRVSSTDKFEVGDFNNDGKDDLFTHQGGYVGLLTHNGTGFTSNTIQNTWLGGWRVSSTDKFEVGDFNNDGKDDLFTHQGGYVGLLTHNGTGFTSNTIQNTWLGGWRVSSTDKFEVGDFNNDGKDDLLVRQASYVGMLTHNGTGFTSNSIQNTWLGGWRYSDSDKIEVGDFNKDGKDDLFTHQGSFVGLLTHDGTGFTSNSIQNTWLGGWRVSSTDKFTVGDFNGDGKDDLLVRQASYVGVLTHNGTGFTSNSIQNTWLGGWRYSDSDKIEVGDFNKDGKDDLLMRQGDYVGLLTYNEGLGFTAQSIQNTWLGGWRTSALDETLVADVVT